MRTNQRIRRSRFAALLSSMWLLVACGGAHDVYGGGGGPHATTSGGGSGVTGSSGSGSSSGGNSGTTSGTAAVTSFPASGPFTGGEACSALTATISALPLQIYAISSAAGEQLSYNF